MATRQDSYHNTVSKMARKYSQCHKLPEISELLILRSDSSEIGYEDQKDKYAQVKHVLPIQQTANQMDKPLFSETDEFEMRQAMEQMVDNEMEKIKIKQEFEQEFEQELIRRKSDPQFCNELNVDEWDCYEVAFWLDTNGYNYCMKTFFDLHINGNVLLYDINMPMLKILGVKALHYHKFIRNINKLKANKQKCNEIELMEEYNLNKINIQSESCAVTQDFHNNVQLTKNALEWNCEEVCCWLYTINMKKYVQQFMESFVDGQILLKDINYSNLIHDLQIKSIHAPKIIREINKLKTDMRSSYEHQYNVTNVNIESKQNIINDLSDTTNQSNMSLCSEGNINTLALLSQNEYIKQLEIKNRELTTLLLSADNNLKKYTKTIESFQQRISNLELENETSKKTIDKLKAHNQRTNRQKHKSVFPKSGSSSRLVSNKQTTKKKPIKVRHKPSKGKLSLFEYLNISYCKSA